MALRPTPERSNQVRMSIGVHANARDLASIGCGSAAKRLRASPSNHADSLRRFLEADGSVDRTAEERGGSSDAGA